MYDAIIDSSYIDPTTFKDNRMIAAKPFAIRMMEEQSADPRGFELCVQRGSKYCQKKMSPLRFQTEWIDCAGVVQPDN
jgi:hypothetical protein